MGRATNDISANDGKISPAPTGDQARGRCLGCQIFCLLSFLLVVLIVAGII